jgi:GTPase SAR1 family protein
MRDHERAVALLEEVARELGATSVAEELQSVVERLRQGIFFVVCIGQFKRGKSTLLNALVGDPVLPVGVAPVTSCVTILRYGTIRSARVRYAGRSQEVRIEDIAEFVSEDRNPENEKGVRAVEVFLPSPLLAGGMCLVDTPGIGSVFAGNTAMTREFVPRIDAALAVLGADPPISGEELELLQEVSGSVSHLVVVMNKADRLPDSDRALALEFTRRVLEKCIKQPIGRIFEVSAVEIGSRDWRALGDAMVSLARDAGASLASQGTERGMARVARALRQELDGHRRALNAPLETTHARVAQLRETVAAGERSVLELSHLLDAQHAQLDRTLTRERAAFLARARPIALARLAEMIEQQAEEGVGSLRAHSAEIAQEIAKRMLDDWRIAVQPAAEAHYARTEERFAELANALVGRLRALGEETDWAPPVGSAASFRARSGLFYTELMTLTSPSFATWVADRFRTRSRARRAVFRSVSEYLDHLLVTNSSRIMYDLEGRERESRRLFEAQVRKQLGETVARAERALMVAQRRHSEGAEAVRGELGRLDRLSQELDSAVAGTP